MKHLRRLGWGLLVLAGLIVAIGLVLVVPALLTEPHPILGKVYLSSIVLLPFAYLMGAAISDHTGQDDDWN